MLVFTPDMHGRFTWRCFAFAAIVFRFLRSSGRLSILNFCNNSEYPEMLRLFLTRVWFMWNMFQLVYVFLQTELCRMISKSCQQESRRPTMTLWQIRENPEKHSSVKLCMCLKIQWILACIKVFGDPQNMIPNVFDF